MLRLYFKQALELIRQSKLFSALYIGGTGLAIATTTIMAIMLYVKVAPLYPEYNKSKIYYVENLKFFNKGNIASMAGLSYSAVNDWFYSLKNAEVVSAQETNFWVETIEVMPVDESYRLNLMWKKTDSDFFKIFSFEFLEGRPFSKAEFESEANVVAISDIVAQRMFGTLSNVAGKTIVVSQEEYRVCGVFKEPSRVMTESFTQVIIPYKKSVGNEGYGCQEEGPYKVSILCKDEKQAEAMRAEVKEIERKYNSSAGKNDYKIDMKHYPIKAVEKVIERGEKEFSWKTLLKKYGVIFIVLLLVPALNLSGIISGRMETRLIELGVRKSFGATRQVLLSQVLWENMLLTLIGGLVGFIITCVMLYFGSSWVFTMLDSGINTDGDIRLTADMLFSPAVFLFSFLVCIALNVLSAIIPAWNTLRYPIVESLNFKK